ncbi:MAG: type III-B CRISPR module RAMP protein Cmr1 [Nitrososphaerales archaeon]
MSSWLELQKNLVEAHELIAEIDVETITLTRIGGYKATPYSLKQNLPSEPTAKSLKGVWRWWARTAIVGACNGKIDYKKANEYLNKILGGTGKSEGVSLFRLEISDVRFPENFETKLSQINNEIDNFYNKAKDFLMNQVSQLHLPQNTEVSVTLNPSTPAIIIQNKTIPLDQYRNDTDNSIKRGPLKDYFVKSELRLKRNKRYHRIFVTLQISKLNRYSQIPRVRLLLMKRRLEEEDNLKRNNIDSEQIIKYLERIKEEMAVLVSEGIKFRISLYGSKDVEKVNFVLSSLMLSLILGGIGSMTKRAFGSLKLLSFRFGPVLKIDQEIQEIFQELQNKQFTKDELKKMLENLCNITVNYAKRLFNIREVQESRDIPNVPSLSNIKIEVIECSSLDLVKIGEAFVKQTWKLSPMAQGRDLHTWILGLPRFQQGTGYAIKINRDYESPRRLSSIGVRCFKAHNKNFIIVFGLLSNDWPKNLWHIRHKGPELKKQVKDISIGSSLQKVFDQAFREVSNRVCQK